MAALKTEKREQTQDSARVRAETKALEEEVTSIFVDSDGYAREVMDVALSRESTDIVVSMGRAGPLDPPSPEADSMIDDMGENGGRVGSGLCDSTDDGRAHYRRVEADVGRRMFSRAVGQGRDGSTAGHEEGARRNHQGSSRRRSQPWVDRQRSPRDSRCDRPSR